jgi:3-hydroxy-9,10-secoandrosta-1,3,5(10)-triene-9,17-dione monooxygenase reductase component
VPVSAGDNQGPSGASLRYGDPWAAAPEARDPVRRLRGRLVMPVTIWLAQPPGGGAKPVGLTISSVLLAQGEPAMLAGLVSPDHQLGELLSAGGVGTAFVVHVLGAGHRRLAQHFAGEVPAPEEMLAVSGSPHGPVLDAVTERLFCRTVSMKPLGWSLLVEAEVGLVEAGAPGRGLAWYHGSYRVVEG